MFKQNGRCSKIVPKPVVFACFLNIRSCQPKQTRDMQRIQKSSKTTCKISDCLIEIKCIFDHFWHRFPSPKFGRLGEGLGPDFGLDFRPCWGPKRRPNGIKKSSRKKVPTWAQHEPQHDPKRPPKTASWIGVAVGVAVQDRLLTALMPNKPSWTPFWHHVGPFLIDFGPLLDQVSRIF